MVFYDTGVAAIGKAVWKHCLVFLVQGTALGRLAARDAPKAHKAPDGTIWEGFLEEVTSG